MEKVIPSMQDLAVFLRLLPRSATGQGITSYVSMVTGPRRSDDEDGPEEFHLIIVDNGRSKMLADPDLREALYCIRCAACLNICPVYQKVGGHAYGWVYPGPIGAIVTPSLIGLKEARDLPQASSLCGACREVCPVKINLPRMLLHLRQKSAESPDSSERSAGLVPNLVAAGYTRLMRSPGLLKLSHGWARWKQNVWAAMPLFPLTKRNGMIRKASLPLLSRWTRSRDLPELPKNAFRDIWKKELSKDKDGR